MKINLLNKYQILIDIGLKIKKVQLRYGLCSKIFGTDNHILLWDFDEVSMHYIETELLGLQIRYNLPMIFIFRSSLHHYHAYCFTCRSFKETIGILADTKTIDIDYFKLGVARGYYTLRFSPKNKESIILIKILKSIHDNEVTPFDISVNEYLTTNI